jgi:hypothetical protein
MKRCFLIGGGPSVKEHIANGLWDILKGQDVWSINFAFMTMPYLPQRELFTDTTFFRNNTPELEKISRQGVKFYSKKHRNYLLIPEMNTYECIRTRLNSVYDDKIFIGNMGLSGCFALSIACKEEYDEVYLFGYDFGTVNPLDRFTHFYQNDIKVQSDGITRWEIYRNPENSISKNVKDFEYYLLYPKTKIFNISLGSNIPYFPKLTLEQMKEQIKCESK